MWGFKTETVPIVIRALGLVENGRRKKDVKKSLGTSTLRNFTRRSAYRAKSLLYETSALYQLDDTLPATNNNNNNNNNHNRSSSSGSGSGSGSSNSNINFT